MINIYKIHAECFTYCKWIKELLLFNCFKVKLFRKKKSNYNVHKYAKEKNSQTT